MTEERESAQKQEAEQIEADKKKNNLWEAIKEVSDLEEHVRYDAVKMIHQLGMKYVFIIISVDEHYGWIKHNVIGFWLSYYLICWIFICFYHLMLVL